MRYLSTRDPSRHVSLSQAIAQGISPDGGLFVPESLSSFTPESFEGLTELPQIGARLIAPFAAGDVLGEELDAICREAFTFPAPLVSLPKAAPGTQVLELFHGPTCAFKDFGARFLAACMARIRRKASRKLTILVATSGDTGGAVAAAFHNRPWVDVAVLYPKGRVSERQAQQLSCWGGNVRTFAVHGMFDDCQRMVKEAFLDASLRESHELSSANSINVGRLLPQMVHYAKSSLEHWRATKAPANFIIPTGNLGNAMACVWARQMGLPIGEIVLVTNENRTIPDFLATGAWQPQPSKSTLASAMDVGNPSNMERLRALYPDIANLRSNITAYSVSDLAIRATVRRDFLELGYVWCPHSATAAEVHRHLVSAGSSKPWIIVSTAHPAKFNDIVEPIIGQPVPVPPSLSELLALPRVETDIEPTLSALRGCLQQR